MILATRTDTWDVELYLLSNDGVVAEKKFWNAGRNLSKDLLLEIQSLAEKDDGDVRNHGYLKGLIVFEGPGSFTGLRICVSVMNAIAYSLNIPVVGTKSDAWLKEGIQRLRAGENDEIIIPSYGRDPNITQPKK